MSNHYNSVSHRLQLTAMMMMMVMMMMMIMMVMTDSLRLLGLEILLQFPSCAKRFATDVSLEEWIKDTYEWCCPKLKMGKLADKPI